MREGPKEEYEAIMVQADESNCGPSSTVLGTADWRESPHNLLVTIDEQLQKLGLEIVQFETGSDEYAWRIEPKKAATTEEEEKVPPMKKFVFTQKRLVVQERSLLVAAEDECSATEVASDVLSREGGGMADAVLHIGEWQWNGETCRQLDESGELDSSSPHTFDGWTNFYPEEVE